MSYERIAKEIGKSKSTLILWARDFRTEIDNLRSIQLDGLYEKYFMMREHRSRDNERRSPKKAKGSLSN